MWEQQQQGQTRVRGKEDHVMRVHEVALLVAAAPPEKYGDSAQRPRGREDANSAQVSSNCHIGVGSVEFCKGARQSGLVSVWQHTLVGQQLQGFL